MADISNKTLIYLLGIVVVISLGWTFIILNRISKISPAITGLGTSGTGIANLSVFSVTSISVSGTVDFGSGRVNSSSGAELQSNDSDTASTDQNGTWDWSNVMYFKIVNDGNTNISLNTSSNASASTFIGGTTISPLFQLALSQEEILPTDLKQSCNSTVENNTWVHLTDLVNYTICPVFDYNNAYDELNISIRLVVPKNTEKSEKKTTVYFFATSIS